MSIDWNLAASLLHVAEKTTQWPTLHGLRDKALSLLNELDAEAAKEMKEIRDKEAKAKADAEAKAQAAGAEPAAQGAFASRQQRFGEKEAT